MPRSRTELAEPKLHPDPAIVGLRAIGTVAKRTRRSFVDKQTGEERTCVTYTLNCGTTELAVDAWNVTEFLAIGQSVDIPVRVRPFMSRGGPRFSLVLQGHEGGSGVEF